MELFLIDAIAPFFKGITKQRINWSKIPFAHLAIEEPARTIQFAQIAEDLVRFTSKAQEIGYNAVTLDDVAHLADHPSYEPEIRKKIACYQQEFKVLFQLISQQGLRIYLTMDLLSYTPQLKQNIGLDHKQIAQFVHELLQGVFKVFPEVDGIIMRVGESDGKDVRDDFRSELAIRTPQALNELLHQLLPLFETTDKQLILRNWTVGAYRLGDLIWRDTTLSTILAGIDSPQFILSLKYGDSDFFRYLELNPHFFTTTVKKIIELQTKREYEGCGEYPSFIGADYERYAQELQEAENLVGISVWCQTGGWVSFRRLCFLEQAAIWTELNTFVTLHIFRYHQSAEAAVRRYCQRAQLKEADKVWTLLQLSEQAVKTLLYIPEYASQQLYFRRVRIPPLLAVYWNAIFINHSMRKIMRHFVRDTSGCIAQGYEALQTITSMRHLARQCDLPEEDLDYMYDTFAILTLAREYYFLPYSPKIRQKIKKAKKRYKKKISGRITLPL